MVTGKHRTPGSRADGSHWFFLVPWVAVCLLANLGSTGCTPVWNGYDGIFVAAEPTDLQLYRNILPPKFEMPKVPMVAFYVGNFYDVFPIPVPMSLDSIKPYYEAKFFLRCVYMGNEGWHAASALVTDKGAMNAGRMVGFPKFIPKSMTLTKTDTGWIGDARDDDKVYYHLELTKGGLDETALKPWQKEFLAGNKYSNIVSTLHQVVPPTSGSTVVSLPIINTPPRRQLVAGMVSVQLYAPFNGLIPSGPLPGLYQKFDVNPNRYDEASSKEPAQTSGWAASPSSESASQPGVAVETPTLDNQKRVGQVSCDTWGAGFLPGPGLFAWVVGFLLWRRRR